MYYTFFTFVVGGDGHLPRAAGGAAARHFRAPSHPRPNATIVAPVLPRLRTTRARTSLCRPPSYETQFANREHKAARPSNRRLVSAVPSRVPVYASSTVAAIASPRRLPGDRVRYVLHRLPAPLRFARVPPATPPQLSSAAVFRRSARRSQPLNLTRLRPNMRTTSTDACRRYHRTSSDAVVNVVYGRHNDDRGLRSSTPP